jgi:transcriptional regulator with XRE-family HTH domain
VGIHSRHKKTASKVAAALRAARIRQGLSMNRLAEMAGMSQQMVSYVERGMRIPTLDTLLRLSCVMKINLGQVINKAIALTTNQNPRPRSKR